MRENQIQNCFTRYTLNHYDCSVKLHQNKTLVCFKLDIFEVVITKAVT